MARSYGHIMSAIWNDPEFQALTGAAQRAYLMLVTQADISSAGTLPLTVRRWSRYAVDTPSDALSDALSELAGRRFLVIDDDTEEVLVRSFVKWDGGYTNSKRLPAIIDAAQAVCSPRLRQALAAELDRLAVEHHLSDSPSDALSDSPSDSTPDSPRVVVTEGESDPQPTTHNPDPKRRAAQPRGTRLPDDWKPNDDMRTWTLSQLSQADAARELTKFRNYWQAKAGAAARKIDWDKTWHNWVLRVIEERGKVNGSKPEPELRIVDGAVVR